MLNYLILILAVVLFYVYSPYFQRLEPIEYSTSLPLTFGGPMAVNNRLDKAEKLHENLIHWPESMAVLDGKIYTGLGDGRIVSISDKHVQTICRMGIKCEGQHEENLCGRPLGMKFNKKGQLYVADAYLGLFVVDVKTGRTKQLLPSVKFVESKPLSFMNDIAIDDEEDVIYITQSSTRWNISMVVVSIVEHDTSGRLLKYDIKHNTLSVLKDGLSFPNGVVLSHDKQSILLAEGNNHNILRYHIKGPEKGQLTKLPIILPGEPDNISHSKRGHYWATVGVARTASSPTLYDRFSYYPMVRKGFLMMHHMLMSPIATVLRLFPKPEAKELAFELVSLRAVVDLFAPHSIVIEFDENGNIVQSLHSPSGNVSHISEVLEHDGYLYLGSWRNRYLGRVKL